MTFQGLGLSRRDLFRAAGVVGGASVLGVAGGVTLAAPALAGGTTMDPSTPGTPTARQYAAGPAVSTNLLRDGRFKNFSGWSSYQGSSVRYTGAPMQDGNDRQVFAPKPSAASNLESVKGGYWNCQPHSKAPVGSNGYQTVEIYPLDGGSGAGINCTQTGLGQFYVRQYIPVYDVRTLYGRTWVLSADFQFYGGSLAPGMSGPLEVQVGGYIDYHYAYGTSDGYRRPVLNSSNVSEISCTNPGLRYNYANTFTSPDGGSVPTPNQRPLPEQGIDSSTSFSGWQLALTIKLPAKMQQAYIFMRQLRFVEATSDSTADMYGVLS